MKPQCKDTPTKKTEYSFIPSLPGKAYRTQWNQKEPKGTQKNPKELKRTQRSPLENPKEPQETLGTLWNPLRNTTEI